jgi:hypothetical protein
MTFCKERVCLSWTAYSHFHCSGWLIQPTYHECSTSSNDEIGCQSFASRSSAACCSLPAAEFCYAAARGVPSTSAWDILNRLVGSTLVRNLLSSECMLEGDGETNQTKTNICNMGKPSAVEYEYGER